MKANARLFGYGITVCGVLMIGVVAVSLLTAGDPLPTSPTTAPTIVVDDCDEEGEDTVDGSATDLDGPITVTVSVNGQEVGSDYQNAGGTNSFSVTLDTPLADGDIVTISAEDGFGNTSSHSSTVVRDCPQSQ